MAVGHDRNANGKVDTSALGMPNEPIGLCSHPKIGLSNPPDFDKAKVAVSKATTVEVNLVDLGRWDQGR